VDELVEAGFAFRTEHESDRRAWRVRLTDKAWAMEPDVEKVLDAWESLLLASLSESDRAAAKRLLAKIADNAAAQATSSGT
jgi:DNA-binding MarR family transcriptional regulator